MAAAIAVTAIGRDSLRMRRLRGRRPSAAVISRTPDGGSCLTRLVASSTCSRIDGGGSIAVARPSLAAVSRSPLTSSAQVGHCC